MAKRKTGIPGAKLSPPPGICSHRQGYEDTTVEEIIEASGTSRGSFYHYFDGKDALLSFCPTCSTTSTNS